MPGLAQTGQHARSLKAKLRQIGHGGGIAGQSGQKRVVRALDNLSFKAHPGDCVGIVGTNGAGRVVACGTIRDVLRERRPVAE